MTKRAFPDDSDSLPVSINEALNELRENADEIISFLQELKGKQQDVLPEASQHLSRLRSRLAPSFRAFVGADIKSTKPLDTRHEVPQLSSNEVHNPTPWTIDDITTGYPPLPEVHDDELRETAFRHPGKATVSKPSYEVLEWQGDAFLEYAATNLILKTFTRLSSGRRSQMRETLIRNIQLAEYFRAYDMQKYANMPDDIRSDSGRGRSADKDIVKVQADMFESYVAAVLQSRGPCVVTAWLRRLWARTLAADIRKLNDSVSKVETDNFKPSTANAKDQLNTLIMVKGIKVTYKDLPGSGIKKDKKLNLPLFIVGVYLTGWGEQDKLLGIGSALSKTEAGMAAAQRALENEKLMKVYKQKKKMFMDTKMAATATSGSNE